MCRLGFFLCSLRSHDWLCLAQNMTAVSVSGSAILHFCAMLNEGFKTIYDRINQLKAEKNVVILAHYYMPPELQVATGAGGIADFLGDSLGLSLEAMKTSAQHIMFCGVRFMAETALLINPDKKVLMPDVQSGCSLASSITAADIRKLKEQYPGVPVIGYINTYAEAKTEMDICCTSRNAVAIAGALEGDKVIFVPDKFMGQKPKECGEEAIWQGADPVERNSVKCMNSSEMSCCPPKQILIWSCR